MLPLTECGRSKTGEDRWTQLGKCFPGVAQEARNIRCVLFATHAWLKSQNLACFFFSLPKSIGMSEQDRWIGSYL